MRSSDWSSDVCSSDLAPGGVVAAALRLSHLSIGEDPDHLFGRAICGSGHGRDCADLSRPWPPPRRISAQIDRVASAAHTPLALRAVATPATWPTITSPLPPTGRTYAGSPPHQYDHLSPWVRTTATPNP